MAKESGWWKLSTNVEPSDADLGHIAEMIKKGFTSGEICKDESEKKITVRDLCKSYPVLYEYDYKWGSSKNYRSLSEVLEKIGYKLLDDSIEGEYNDIKAYYGCAVEEI